MVQLIKIWNMYFGVQQRFLSSIHKDNLHTKDFKMGVKNSPTNYAKKLFLLAFNQSDQNEGILLDTSAPSFKLT